MGGNCDRNYLGYYYVTLIRDSLNVKRANSHNCLWMFAPLECTASYIYTMPLYSHGNIILPYADYNSNPNITNIALTHSNIITQTIPHISQPINDRI